MSVLYDAGVLIAADRNDRLAWADHRARLELGLLPVTTAPVASQVSRSSRQVSLHRFLKGCNVIAFAPADAHQVGELCAKSNTSDVVDAHLVLSAVQRDGLVITGDIDDLEALASVAPATVVVLPIAQ